MSIACAFRRAAAFVASISWLLTSTTCTLIWHAKHVAKRLLDDLALFGVGLDALEVNLIIGTQVNRAALDALHPK